MHHRQGQSTDCLDGKVPIRDGIQAVFNHTLKAQQVSDPLPVNGERCPGQSPRPKRQLIDPASPLLQPLVVPGQHPEIGQQMVRQPHRLCMLQMGHPRQQRIQMCFGELDQRILDITNSLPQAVNPIPNVEP